MKSNNYNPIKNIDYYNLETYREGREEVKKCLWKVINKFQYYANTFYLALYFIDTIMIKNFFAIKLSNIDIMCIACVVLSSIIMVYIDFR